MNEAIIGLGSNINPEENIKKATDLIAKNIKLIKSSKFIETEPVGFKDQDNFLNGSILINTRLNLNELNKLLKNIEESMGRKKTDNLNGPRIIDLDIVVWNNKILDNDVYKRSFLKSSVMELKPNLLTP